jgi:UDP-N-acetylglucosamine:LPS N-acetylglucosamine transferase
MVNSGAAVMIPQEKLTGRFLAESIRQFYENPRKFEDTKKKARDFGRVNAAKIIADDFMGILKVKTGFREAAVT